MGAGDVGSSFVSSSTFAVIQRIRKSVPLQKHLHWKNTNTQLHYSLYCYSWDWWWQVNAESTVNARSSHSECSRSPSSPVSAQLQLLPWLELRVYTLGAWKKYSLNTWNDSTTQRANTWELGEHLKYLNNLGKNVTLALEKLGKMVTLGKDTAKKLCNTRTFINTSFKCNTPVSSVTFTCMVLTGFLD